ncbi:MAG: CvpA family protein [Limnohabitans sp.]|jgi:membrane protein required for colicin V production|uniref:CvpA family protein n=1 Tax=Limnohabitans sp. TaxID=1907725 RepID=UPI0011D37765|nr:MAG: CvpA family protein [Limnohabitans sp.]
MGLPLTDGVLGGILLLSLVVGAWRGLVHELMSLAGWVAAFVLAQWLADDVARWLPVWREAAVQVRYALSFVLVFVASMLAAAVVSWLLGKVVSTAGLRPVDRSLGGIFGLARGLVVLLVLAVVVHLVGMRSEPWWRESHMTPVLELLLAGIKPVLPQTLQAYLP